MKKNIILRSLLLAGFSVASPFASASYNGFEARSTAMGAPAWRQHILVRHR